MNGIYIHIPFCRKACHYCNFHFTVSLKNKAAFITAVINEIELRKRYFECETKIAKTAIDTIYFGGGTPSLLSPADISEILGALHKHFSVKDKAEITLEANPEDLTKIKIIDFKRLGINRLSIGVQSFFDEDLQYLNRPHSAQRAIDAIKDCKETGYNNISIDLIYALPTLTNDKWNRNLEIAFENNIPHISLYSLTVEPKTPLAHYIQTGKYEALDEQKSVEQYKIAMEKLEKNGYIHYEISNFCMEGFYSVHNSNYWKTQPYLGLGPSAHSFNGTARQWNIANTTEYIKELFKDKLAYKEEILTTNQRYNEYILTTLRTIWGSNLEKIKSDFGVDYFIHCNKIAEKFKSQGKVDIRNNTVYLTNQGKLFADLISAEMFF